MSVARQWERYTTPRHYEFSEFVFKEGDPGDEMYIVKIGKLAVTKATTSGTPLVLGYRIPGDFLGEISLISTDTRTATAQAIKPTTLLAITREDFWRLMETDVIFQQIVMETVIERLFAADEHRVNATLWEHQLSDKLATLSEQHQELVNLMQIRREMVRFIIHDLRNPLNMILTALSMLDLDPEFHRNSSVAQQVALAMGGVRRMFALTDALVEIGRLQSGDYPILADDIDLIALIKHVIERVEPLADTLKIELALINPDETLPDIQADTQFVDRVLTHLIDNALNYTPPGGSVSITIKLGDPWVDIGIADTGPGIPIEQRERIFDRFVQTDTLRQTRGFGLGLAFCRSAIRAHGGQIWVEDGNKGIGSKFMIRLPIYQTDEE